jgi:hypothetical protein
LFSGETLNTDGVLVSPNSMFRAIMQQDGNFVIYNNNNNTPIWNTESNANAIPSDLPFRLTLETEGKLVIYDTHDGEMWSANTNVNVSCYLVMQDDGNLVLYETDTNFFSWGTMQAPCCTVH